MKNTVLPRSHPLFSIFLVFIAGIRIGFNGCFHWPAQILILFLICFFFSLVLYKGIKIRPFWIHFTFLAGILFLGILHSASVRANTTLIEEITTRETVLDGNFSVRQVLKSNDKWAKFIVSPDQYPVTSDILVYISSDLMRHFEITNGTMLNLCFRAIGNKSGSNPVLFDYNQYLQNRGIYLSAFIKDASEIAVLDRNDPMRFFNSTRDAICAKIDSIFSDPVYSGLQKAVLVGVSTDLDEDIMREFRISGAVHVLSISGFHVAVVALSIQYFLGLFRSNIPGTLHMILLLSSIWLFVILAGLSPSAFRSGLMFSLFFIGRLARRDLTSYQVIGFAGMILLLTDPLSIYDLGFQLSFAAVWGIMTFYTYLSALIRNKNKVIRFLWDSISLSLSAQIGTLPILLYNFKEVSMVFWISDILVVPVMSFLLPLSFLVLISASLLDSAIIDWLVFFSERIMDFMIRMNSGISGIENSFIDNLPFDKTMYFLFTLIIVNLGFVARSGKKTMIISSLVMVFILLSYNIFATSLSHNQRIVIQYAHPKNVVIEYVDGQNSTIFYQKEPDRNLKEAMRFQKMMLRLNGNRRWVSTYSENIFPIRIGDNYWLTDKDDLTMLPHENSISSLFLLGRILYESPDIFDDYIMEKLILPMGLNTDLRIRWSEYAINRKIEISLQDEDGLVSIKL